MRRRRAEHDNDDQETRIMRDEDDNQDNETNMKVMTKSDEISTALVPL